MAADLVVFDPDRIIDRGTYEVPVQAPEGIAAVIQGGRLCVDAR
jgi:N-acyl-D-amino-acid deacylase